MAKLGIDASFATPQAKQLAQRLVSQIMRIEFTPDPLRTDLYNALTRAADAMDGMLARHSATKPSGVRQNVSG